MKTLTFAIALATTVFANASANAINPYPTDAFEGITEQSLQLESWMFAAEEIATEQSLQLESWMFATENIAEDSLEVEPEHRQKEIGIRKVNGASVLQILAMFNRKYMIITIVCALIAVPLAFVIINAYFNGFAYHYAINLWIFIIGVVIVMAITALVVTAASFRAANENPVNTLKTE